MKSTITAIILTKNEAGMLHACLACLDWCEEIIVIDGASTDDTVKIAENFGCKVLQFEPQSFARRREKALDFVKTDWLFYVDADERVSPELATEILQKLSLGKTEVFGMRRDNVCYGQHLQYGGWQKDFVTRVFKKTALKGWQGEIHESPIYHGQMELLEHSLLHLTHRSTQENLQKSAAWTIREAELLAAKEKKPVTAKTLLRKAFMEWWRRFLLAKGYKDGMVGWVEALVQAMNRLMVYIQVWELQQKPSLVDRYKHEEEKVRQAWQQSKKTE